MPDGQVLPQAFRFPDLSVVRSNGPTGVTEFEASDALWVSEAEVPPGGRVYYPEAAVIAFRVQAVPPIIEREGGARPYSITVEHVPYDDMYPHSEVRGYVDGVRVVGSESRFKVRQKLKEALAKQSRQVHP